LPERGPENTHTDGTTPPPALRLVSAEADGRVQFHPHLTVLVGPEGHRVAELIADGTDLLVAPDDGEPVAVDELPDEFAGGPVVISADGLQDLLSATTRLALTQLTEQNQEMQRDLTRLRREQDERASDVIQVSTRLDQARRRGRAATRQEDGEAATLAEELLTIEEQLLHRRSRDVIQRELAKWERVVEEAQGRLTDQRDHASHVEPSDLAEAGRLRSEWRYAEQVHRQERRRRTRREMDEHRARYERFLAQFGATCYEDLTVVGTGFGNTDFDLAIREAATVVSMAEQHCIALREELTAFDGELERRRATAMTRASELLGRSPGNDPIAELRALPVATRTLLLDGDGSGDDITALTSARDIAVDEHDRLSMELQSLEGEAARINRVAADLVHADRTQVDRLNPSAIESLLDHALELDEHELVTPAVLDGALDSIASRSRRRALATVAGHSRHRQIVLVTNREDIATWAEALPADAAEVLRYS
jgi:hypothetical protein